MKLHHQKHHQKAATTAEDGSSTTGRVAITADVWRGWLDTAPDKVRDLYDAKHPQLVLRLRPSGTHSWLVRLGRGHWETIGQARNIAPEQARQSAEAMLGRVSTAALALRSENPDLTLKQAHANARGRLKGRRQTAQTWRQFLDGKYQESATATMKSARETLRRLRVSFADFLDVPLRDIDSFRIERWRAARLKSGTSAATVKRDLESLKAAFAWAVHAGHARVNPAEGVKLPKLDIIGRLRYLSPAEETRLRAALDAREEDRRQGRQQFNAWRAARGYGTIPDFPAYVDHLQPIVLLALNTGARRGELLGLTWGDLELPAARLTIRGVTAKSGRTRHIPLNSEALGVLRTWRTCVSHEAADPVFPGPTGEPMTSLKTSWAKLAKAARLKGFRFHDLRHSFASKLVMSGVDLNTVRALLGHAGLAMTLRYSHLSQEHTAAAVAKLARA